MDSIGLGTGRRSLLRSHSQGLDLGQEAGASSLGSLSHPLKAVLLGVTEPN